MRVGLPLGPAVAVLALALLAGCGDDEPAGVRLQILTGAIDGPVTGTVQLEALDGADAGRIYEAVPLGGGDPDVYYAPGAPDGYYRVLTDTGWGMLWAGTLGASSPHLHGPGTPPAPVRMGKPHSLYVAPTDPNVWQLGDTWGADCKYRDEPLDGFRPIPVTVERDPEGIIALRFRPEDWTTGNVVRVVGRMTTGHLTTLISYAVRDRIHPRLPRLTLVHGAEHVPLDLHLVPTTASDPVPDGTQATIELVGIPFTERMLAESFQGRVSFPLLAAISKVLRVRLPASGPRATFDLDINAWRTRGAMYLVPVSPEVAVPGIALPASGDPAVAVRAHFGRGTALGRLPIEFVVADGDPGRTEVQTPPGPQEWFVETAGGRWSHGVLDVQPGADVGAALGAPRAGCRISGTVRGASAAHRVEFRLVLPEAKDAAGAVVFPARRLGGFTATISLTGQYEIQVPPGKVEVRVVGPTGHESTPKTRDLDPGSRLRLDLSLR